MSTQNLKKISDGVENTDKSVNLTLNISNIKSDSGFIRIHLYNAERKEYFPKKTRKCFQRQVEKIQKGHSIAVFENLPADFYCLSVHHDENSNEQMDTNFLGIPKEGWGISNNVKLFMRLPEFDECSFRLNGKDTSINVEMRY